MVGFYGISTLVGYLMPNPVCTYMIYKHFEDNISKLDRAQFLYTIKWFQVFLFNNNYLFRIVKWFQVFLFNTNYLFAHSSSSSCRDASTDIPDPLSALFPIVHRLWQVFWATSRIITELLYVCSSWSSCFTSSIRGGP